MLSVGQLVEDLGLPVLAGASALERTVRWVHISELPDPTPWLSGGELLLTTGMRLPGDGSAYVARLAEHGLAGVGIGLGTEPGLSRVPEAMVQAADERNFPLVEVPRETPFIAITERAASAIVNEHYETLRRAAAAHAQLERIVLAERGLAGIADALARVVRGCAAVIDSRGATLASAGGGSGEVEGLVAELRRRRARAEGGTVELQGAFGLGAIALPVPRAAARGSRAQAWLLAEPHERPLSELDRLVLQQAVTTIALELLRGRVAADTERRLAGDVLSSVLSGQLEGAELRRRLEPFGISDALGVLVLAPPEEIKEQVEESLSAIMRARGAGGIAGAAGQLSCALLPAAGGADGESPFLAEAESLREQVSAAVGHPLHAGAARPVAASDVRRGFHEARCAVDARRLGSDTPGRPLLATHRDLGSFQLLLTLQDDHSLRLFCDSILAPVEQGEGQYGEELLRSLEVFIESNGHWERAARQLFCHRHTLRYRIRRVEELTGRSLDSARDRIDFWLALRGRELLS